VPLHLPVQVELKTRWLSVPIAEEVYRSGDLFAIIASVTTEVQAASNRKGSRPQNREPYWFAAKKLAAHTQRPMPFHWINEQLLLLSDPAPCRETPSQELVRLYPRQCSAGLRDDR